MSAQMHYALLDVLFLIAPVVILQLIDNRPFFYKFKRAISFAAASGIAAGCLLFPIRIAPAFSIDFSWIPLLLTHTYVGYAVSGPLAAVIALLRYAFDGNAAAALTVGAVFLIPPRRFEHLPWSIGRKAAACAALSACYAAVLGAVYGVQGLAGADKLLPAAGAFALMTAGAAGMTAIIELWTQNDRIRNTGYQALYERIEKYNLVSQLAASVSHEVRNPLTVTKGVLQMMRSGAIGEKERDKFYDLALEELDRAHTMITDYLSFAKHDPKLSLEQRFDQGEDLRHVVNVITPYALIHSVQIDTSFEPNCWTFGNVGKYRQCIINLCKNAIEAMPQGGRLRIELKRAAGGAESLLLIQDEGVGMSEAQLDRIGIPYETTKENGTGLGIAVVFRTIADMGGNIRFASSPGAGTTVSVRLPLLTEVKKDEGSAVAAYG